MPSSDSTLVSAPGDIDPVVHITSQQRLFQDVRRKIFPSEIRGILSGALMGNLFFQDQLFSLMTDSWARLQKNLRALTGAVSRVNYLVTPYQDPGTKTPSATAIQKAETVSRALWSFQPLTTRNERDFEGLLSDIVEATLVGISVNEILWELRPSGPNGALEYMPRASIRVPASFYRYPSQMDVIDELLFDPSGTPGGSGLELVPFPANKFVIAIYQGHSGHPSVSMPLRCLTALWACQVFGLEWFSTSAQLFGIPFRKGTFEKGDTEGYNLLMSMLAQMGSAGYAALPTNTNVEFIMAPGNGAIGPAERLVDLADRICDIFVLGKTLSTDVGNSGSRALGEVHADVKQDIIEGVADFTGRIIQQLARAIVALNYGEESEVPTIAPDIKNPGDALGLVQRDQILFQQMALPVAESYLYERHGVPQPSKGTKLYQAPPVPVSAPI